jgi:hypothetical protein
MNPFGLCKKLWRVVLGEKEVVQNGRDPARLISRLWNVPGLGEGSRNSLTLYASILQTFDIQRSNPQSYP